MHAATLWQITLATDAIWASPVISIFTTIDLTLISFIDGLTPSTSYIARVAYYDNLGATVGFSADFPFTTLAADAVDPPGSFAEAEQGCSDC